VIFLSISEDEVYSLVEPHLAKTWECVSNAFHKYKSEYPDQTIHRRATRANLINDLVFAQIVTEFDEQTDCRILEDRKRNLRFLVIGERVMLWFKKVDQRRQPSNYLTSHARRLLSGKQLTIFPQASVILVGYLLNSEESQVRRVSFSPPSLFRPKWFFDVEAEEQPAAMAMPGPRIVERPTTRIRVVRGAKQMPLGG
jgi:hypothetical protein